MPSDGQNSPICTRFPKSKWVFLSLCVRCVLRHFLVHLFSMPRYTVCMPGIVLNCSPEDLANVAVIIDIYSSFGRYIWGALELIFFGRVTALLSYEAQGRKDCWKPSKPCHVGIHWITLWIAEYSQMSPNEYPCTKVSVILQVYCIIFY